jgi:methylglyoxal synthase
MAYQELLTKSAKRLALVAHDNKKQELLEWARFNRELLAGHELYATGTTGRLLRQTLGLDVVPLQSGPLGGDQQIGSKVVEGQIDFLIFFWDPLEPQPHDPDVKALIRIAVVWNIPVACNRASADFMISSPLMASEYTRLVPDYDAERIDIGRSHEIPQGSSAPIGTFDTRM